MNRNIAIFVVIIILSIVAIFSFSGNIITPYISFQDAKKRAGEFVQIIGALDKTKNAEQREKLLSFRMVDSSGTFMDISYEGIKPQNFEQTDKIVLLGAYRDETKTFKAEKLLVKCPSKYTRER